MAYDVPTRPKDSAILTLSALDLDRQVGSNGETGFGREVNAALDRRAERLAEMGHATI